MDPHKTALILIGYQNDYFSEDGILYSVIQEAAHENRTLDNTLGMLAALKDTGVMMITTPIVFTEDYSELVDPVGILQVIKEVGAFKEGSRGAEEIQQIKDFGSRIINVPGKRGLNAFSNTELAEVLSSHGITDVVLAGAVTSICIDSTGRSAFERGFKVSILADCTTGRSQVEQEFYCDKVFPLYSRVIKSDELLAELGVNVKVVA